MKEAGAHGVHPAFAGKGCVKNGVSSEFSKQKEMERGPTQYDESQVSETECKNSGRHGKPSLQNNNPSLKGATIAAFRMPLTT
jgi:hypothetical protein